MIRKLLIPLACAAALLAPPVTARAVTPDVPRQYAGTLAASWDGAQLKAAWQPVPFGSNACPTVPPGNVRLGRTGNLNLRTSGANGSCAAVETARTWHTGVFEARVYLPGVNGRLADWPAFWFTAIPWPLSGEIDAMEGLHGTVQAHYHYGTFTSRLSKGTTTGTLPVYSPRPGPGWHTLDLVWAPSWARVYYDGRLFTVMQGTWFKPGSLHMILDMTQGTCGNGSASVCGGPSEAASMAVAYVRVWRFR